MRALLLLSLMLGCLQIGPTAQEKGSEKKNDEFLSNLIGGHAGSQEEFDRKYFNGAMTVGINWRGNIHRYYYKHGKCYLRVYVDDGASKYLHDHKNFIQKSADGRMVIGGAKHKIYPKCVDSPLSAGRKQIIKFFSDDSSKPLFDEPQWQLPPDGFEFSRLYLSGKGVELTILMALVYYDETPESLDDEEERPTGGESCRLTADAGGNIKDLKCESLRSVPRVFLDF